MRNSKIFNVTLLATLISVASNGALGQNDSSEEQQETDEPSVEYDEEVIVVHQVREGLKRSLEIKRETTVVADALFGGEIGELPDLSVAETLERITGVTADRFKGGASEMSVRGLGAFLSASTFNGREITSGSDGRNVNFGQFPSELVGGTLVYKSQQASFVEGGVAGIIELKGIRPIDFQKRRVQVQGLLGYSENEARVNGGEDFNQRYTGSFIDNWESSIGNIGLAIGLQHRDDTAPEDVFTTSSTFRPCNTVGASGNCSYNAESDEPFYLVSNQYIYRAMKTDADRDAVFATFQWQPSDNWNFVLDYQISDRRDVEERANLVLADGRRGLTPIEIAPSGALLAVSGESRIENSTVYRERDEAFEGIGLAMEWDNDKMLLSADISYNKTERRQDELDMRIRRNERVNYVFDRRGTNVPNWVLDDATNFNLTVHDNYDNGPRARRRLENNDDSIFAARFDSDFRIDSSFVQNIKAGLRLSSRERTNDDGIDCTTGSSADNCSNFELVEGGYNSEAAIAARQSEFIVDGFFAGADTDFALTEWATWDARELFAAITGSPDAGLFDPGTSTVSFHDTDVTEDVLAAYFQVDYASELFGLPVYGNVGVRVVETEVESVGALGDVVTIDDGSGNISLEPDLSSGVLNTQTNSFTNVLPSASINFELQDNMIFRVGLYRAMARPDARQMSAGFQLVAIDDFDAETDSVSDLLRPSGNPALEPLTSNNFDLSWEWYISDDTALSVAGYYKILETGLENVADTVAINFDGAPVEVDILRQGNSDESSTLQGFELTGQHVFSTLPQPFDGFGVRAGINYAESDFETEDPTSVDGNALADFVPPGNINGYSQTSLNASIFWENRVSSIRLAYRERSEYLKSFRIGPNRYTERQGFLDFSFTYKLNKSIQLRLQALNILDEPNVFNRPVQDNVSEASYGGARYLVGVRYRL